VSELDAEDVPPVVSAGNPVPFTKPHKVCRSVENLISVGFLACVGVQDCYTNGRLLCRCQQ